MKRGWLFGLCVSSILALTVPMSWGAALDSATDHARFYPEQTQFYTDFAPGDVWAQNGTDWILSLIERFEADKKRHVAEVTASAKPKMVRKKVKGRWVWVKQVAPKPPVVTKKTDDDMTPRQMLMMASAFVEPKASVGVWDFKTENGGKKAHGSLAVVITAKPTLLPEIIQSFAKDKLESQQSVDAIGTLFIPKSKHSPLVLLTNDHHVVLTDDKEAMDKVMDVLKGTSTPLANNAMVKDALTYLSSDPRQGTFFMDNKTMSFGNLGFSPSHVLFATPLTKTIANQASAKTETTESETDKKSDADDETAKADALHKEKQEAYFRHVVGQHDQLLEAMPYTVGGVWLNDDRQLFMDTITPLLYSKVTDTKLRAELQAMMMQQDKTMLPEVLPENTMLLVEMKNLGPYIRSMINLFATEEMQKEVKEKLPSLFKASKFTLNKHVIGLVDKEFGFAVLPEQTSPGVVGFLTLNPDTQEFVDWGMTLMTEQASKNGWSITKGNEVAGSAWMTIVTPKRSPFEFALAPLQTSTLVVGKKQTVETVRDMLTTASALQGPLAQASLYKRLSGKMPQQLQWWAYWDATQSASTLDQYMGTMGFLPKSKQPVMKAKDVLEPLEGAAAWAYTEPNKGNKFSSLYHGQFVLQFAHRPETRK